MNMKHLLSLALGLAVAATASAQVYTQTNEAGTNRLAEIRSKADGGFTRVRYFNTGGAGSGNGLGIQGALTFSSDHRYLFVVNAGSNDISTFYVSDQGVRLINVVPSGGTRPVSITSVKDLVYVVNANSSNISGFYLTPAGLVPIAGSTEPLSTNTAAPGQISFNPDGDTLYVTEKNNNRVTFFSVDSYGVASAPSWVQSPGSTPFGFAFGRRGKLFVSEAFPGIVNSSAVTSYLTDDAGLPTVAAGSVPTFQTAACWVAMSPNGQFTYAVNAASESVTGFRVHTDGTLALLSGDGVSAKLIAGGGGTDAAADNDNRLFVISSRIGALNVFNIRPDGKLSKYGVVSGLPTTITGLAIR